MNVRNGGPPSRQSPAGTGLEGGTTEDGKSGADFSTRPVKRLEGGAVAWNRPHGVTVDDVLGKPDLFRIFTEHDGVFFVRDPGLPAGSVIAAHADDLTAHPEMYSCLPHHVADYLRRLVARFYTERALAEAQS